MKLIFGLLIMLFSGFIFMNNSGGRAASQGQGNTGAPGDNRKDCKSCHNSSTIVVKLEINLLDANNQKVDKYRPEETYTVQVKFNPSKGSPKAFGFQMVCLNAELNKNGQDLKNWIDDEANNYKISEADNGRSYVEHDEPSPARDFKVKWKAPIRGTGTVSFYSAGNGVNLNSSPSGDGAAKNSISFEEDKSTVVENQLFSDLIIYPNSFSDILYINLPNDMLIRAEIINSNGATLAESKFQNSLSWNLSFLNSGIYHLKLYSPLTNDIIVKKLLKN